MLNLQSRLDFVCRYEVLIGNVVAWWDGNGIELTVPCAMTTMERVSAGWWGPIIERICPPETDLLLGTTPNQAILYIHAIMPLQEKHDLITDNVAAYRNEQISSSILFLVYVIVLN